jgi:prophage regulatory protein
MNNQICRLPAVEALAGIKRSMIYQLVRLGSFPPPVQLTARAIGWRTQDVVAWIESRPVARTCAEPAPAILGAMGAAR